MSKAIIKATKSAPFLVVMGLVIVATAGILFIPHFSQAVRDSNPGAVWTTTGSCGEPQDTNHYQIGDHVFINYAGFSAGNKSWEIKGNSGGASGDPNIVVSSGTETVDESGAGCFDAYTVATDDWGEYQVKFGTKGDNYRVDYGSIKVYKKVDADGNGTFEKDSHWSNDHGFQWQLDGGLDRNFGNNVTAAAGSHDISETMPAGYKVIGWYRNNSDYSCSEPEGETLPATVNVADDHTVTITFCNAIIPKPKLTVTKVVDNQFGGTLTASDFPLFVNKTQVTSGEQNTFDPDDYTISETNQTGYGNPTFTGDCDSEGSITLNPGDVKTCTITNHDIQPKLTVTKEVVGGPKTAADFPLFVDDQSVMSGEQNGFDVGFYHVTETNLPGYTATFSCNDDGEGTVSLNLGDVKTCTIINTYTPYCGDKIVDKGEQCDGNTQACTTADGYSGTQTCNNPRLNTVTAAFAQNFCTWNPCVTEEKCGDGIKNGTEQCDGTDGVASNQTCTAQCTLLTNETPNPVITLVKTDTPDPVAAGANITYTLNWTVSNASATNVVLTDAIPANTTFVSASTPGAYDAVTNKVTWSMGTVATGNYVTTLTVKVNSPLTNGTKIDNTATIDSTETDPVNAVAQTTVSSGPILAIEKLVDVSTVNPGQTVNYTVKVTNTGTDTAYNVKLTDTLPTGFTAKDDGATTVTHSFGNITAGASVSTTFAVIVGTTNAAGEYTNIVRANSDNYAEISAQVALNVIVPQVLGEKTEVTPVPQVLGETTTLPVTGNNAINSSLVVGTFLGAIIGLGLYLKQRLATVKSRKTTK